MAQAFSIHSSVKFRSVFGYGMRRFHQLFPVALLVAFCSAGSARAQMGPVLVVPGRADVPVTINGIVVNGAVVYGDWGLARPGHGEIIIEGPAGYAAPYGSPGYFPATGYAPRLGREEILPPVRPRADTTFQRDWHVQSDNSQPVTQVPPYEPPQVGVQLPYPRPYRPLPPFPPRPPHR
jgi:hypothetical protein